MTKRGIRVCIDVSPGTDGVFRISAADDILGLLVEAHETEFTVQELADATGVARSTVWRAVDLLEATGAVQVRETPQRNYVSVDPERLQRDDPVLAIEQSEFHDPVRAFVSRVRERVADSADVADLVGVVVFGSVARGEADRRSDIDLFVVVDGDRTAARRLVTDVVSTLGEQRFGGRRAIRAGSAGRAGTPRTSGDRFAFEPSVESVESAQRAAGKLREIFEEGITVYGSGDDRLAAVRKAVLTDEQ